MSKTTIATAERSLEILRILERNFAHGYTPGDLAKAAGLSASMVTRHVATLEAKGFAERIPETGRIRLSHRLAQVALQVLGSLDGAAARIEESKQRLTRN